MENSMEVPQKIKIGVTMTQQPLFWVFPEKLENIYS